MIAVRSGWHRREHHVEDLTGQRFGLLVVLNMATSIGTGTRWRCECDCGAVHFTTGTNLRNHPRRTHRNCKRDS
jgi:hypothetical protein